MLLPDKIRHAIGALHAEIEATPLAAAMLGGTVSRDGYSSWLSQMYRLHATLEHLLADVPGLPPVFDTATMTRSAALRRDAAALGVALPDSGCAVVGGLVAQLRRVAGEEPWGLVGALYVLEGSRMGSLALARPLARALGVAARPGAGLDYHLEGAADRPSRWRGFRENLARFAVTPDQETAAVETAVSVMQALVALYSSRAEALVCT